MSIDIRNVLYVILWLTASIIFVFQAKKSNVTSLNTTVISWLGLTMLGLSWPLMLRMSLKNGLLRVTKVLAVYRQPEILTICDWADFSAALLFLCLFVYAVRLFTVGILPKFDQWKGKTTEIEVSSAKIVRKTGMNILLYFNVSTESILQITIYHKFLLLTLYNNLFIQFD